MCLQDYSWVPSAVIGAVVAYIAFAQWRVSKAKFKLDLFEKRMAIFSIAWAALSKPLQSPKTTLEDLWNVNNVLPEAQFLFLPEIREYMESISTKLGEFHVISQATENNDGIVPFDLIQDRAELVKWFLEEATNGCREKFSSYLNFGKW